MQIVFKGAFPPGSRPAVGNVQASFQKNMLSALQPAVDAELADIKGQTPYDSIRGAYGSSTQVGGNSVQINIFNTSPIWKYREYDTRPHTILPTRASILAFPVGGKTVFARVVHHPGTKGNLIVTNTLKQYRPRISQAIQEALHNWLRESLMVEAV